MECNKVHSHTQVLYLSTIEVATCTYSLLEYFHSMLLYTSFPLNAIVLFTALHLFNNFSYLYIYIIYTKYKLTMQF